MIRRRQLRQFFLGFVSLLVASSLIGEEGFVPEEDEFIPELRGVMARNSYFEVLADEMLSAQYVATAGEMLGQRFARMLPRPAGFSDPVLVNLVPAEEADSGKSFRTLIEGSGQVKVTISWGADTSREVVERALAQGHLTYLSGVHSAGVVTVPVWLELAAMHLARVQAVPAHGRYLAMRISASGPMRLETILGAERGEDLDDEFGANAYWLLNFLEREGRSRGQFQHFLIRVLRGEPPAVALNATYGENLRSSPEAQLWWLVGVRDLTRAPGSPMLSAEESNARVKRLSRFAFEADNEKVRLFPEDLWRYRTSATLQDELRHRIAVTRLERAAMHPFYHNVLFSLERLFEAVLAANEEGYRKSLTDYRHDLRVGGELMEDTRLVLDDLEAELSSAK